MVCPKINVTRVQQGGVNVKIASGSNKIQKVENDNYDKVLMIFRKFFQKLFQKNFDLYHPLGSTDFN